MTSQWRYVENPTILVPLVGGPKVPLGPDTTLPDYMEYMPVLVRAGDHYIAVHPFLNATTYTPNQGVYLGGSQSITAGAYPLSPTNACYKTIDLTTYEFLGTSPEWPDWTSKFTAGVGSGVEEFGQAIQSYIDGKLVSLLNVPTSGITAGWGGDLTVGCWNRKGPQDASVNQNSAVLKGPYVGGLYGLSLATDSLATVIGNIQVPFAGLVGSTGLTLIRSGITISTRPGLTPLASYAWEVYQRIAAFLGYDPTNPGGLAGVGDAVSPVAMMTTPTGARAIYAQTALQNNPALPLVIGTAAMCVDVSASSVAIGLVPVNPNNPFAIYENKGGIGLFQAIQAGDWFIAFPNNANTGYQDFTQIQKSRDLVNWYPCARAPWPFTPATGANNSPPLHCRGQ